MKIAIYSRKSKLTEKGESVENQISLCKEYVKKHFNTDECNILIYEDEGYSGGNVQRPQFKKLIKDANNKKFDKIICYRLDRISRNIADFSSLIDDLSKLNIGFISIREQFDTTTPIGRAMMYIASVFAQLERETTAERIKDNLCSLFKSGRYLGQKSPFGFVKKQVEYTDKNGNIKKYNILEQCPETSKIVKLLFKKYLEYQSIHKVQTFCMQNNIKTLNGHHYKCSTIRRILTHPTYAVADKIIYDYLEKMEVEIVDNIEKFNGEFGIVVFRRTRQIKNKNNNPEVVFNEPTDWIATIGKHKGIISSDDWIRTQQIIEGRKSLSIPRPTSKTALLSGLLRCEKCKSHMRPFSIDRQSGRFYYVCATKEASRKTACDMKNIRGDKLDVEIVADLKSKFANNDEFLKSLFEAEQEFKKKNDSILAKGKLLEKELKQNNNSIKNLIIKLSKTTDSTIEKYIEQHIKQLDSRNKEIKILLETISDEQENDKVDELSLSLVTNSINKLNNEFDSIEDVGIKRNLLSEFITAIYWDGKNIKIEFVAI